METPFSFWLGFNLAVIALLLADLAFLGQKPKAPSFLQSLLTTLVWVALAAGFGCWIVHESGWKRGTEFFTGYVIEYSLSVDNLFLFVLIFTDFRVPPGQQRRLLFWGVIGALVMRGLLIMAGAALLRKFEWVFYLFGAYILFAGARMLAQKGETEAGKLRVVCIARRILPISDGECDGRFFTREGGRFKFTLLFLVLVVVEITDLIFALDSIPAVFGVTRDPFIVYTSNVCAVLGLRSLYFLLARAVRHLVWLRAGLGCILIFIGAKMIGEEIVPVSTEVSLCVIAAILAVSIIASLVKTAKREANAPIA
ncbi:MAG TPA: TerC/Alx family metal homeostasis membrane protein [Candidatus Methylacidiphilales bacterium]|nr:TerC/Alx family metal homeostasis membrane protein [Candidatus Methylacidiphilales bacterium]